MNWWSSAWTVSLSPVSHCSWWMEPEWRLLEPLLYSSLVRSTGDILVLQFGSWRQGCHPVGLSLKLWGLMPSPVSSVRVGLNCRTPSCIAELLVMWSPSPYCSGWPDPLPYRTVSLALHLYNTKPILQNYYAGTLCFDYRCLGTFKYIFDSMSMTFLISTTPSSPYKQEPQRCNLLRPHNWWVSKKNVSPGPWF